MDVLDAPQLGPGFPLITALPHTCRPATLTVYELWTRHHPSAWLVEQPAVAATVVVVVPLCRKPGRPS